MAGEAKVNGGGRGGGRATPFDIDADESALGGNEAANNSCKTRQLPNGGVRGELLFPPRCAR